MITDVCSLISMSTVLQSVFLFALERKERREGGMGMGEEEGNKKRKKQKGKEKRCQRWKPSAGAFYVNVIWI